MRKALLIGSQTGELGGVHNDVDTMSTLLTKRGFEIDRRIEGDASRDGILDGYRSLISSMGKDDAAVVYFSGHGGLARSVTPDGDPAPEIQFIVPTDYDDSKPGDFRGITAIELSVLLAELTQRTRNATVLLDCCHAAHLSRDPNLRVRGLPHPTYLDVTAHLRTVRALGLQEELVDPVSNPDAVRLVACAQWESAYEYTNNYGTVTGVATDSLRVALDELGDARVSWGALIQRVRDRVVQLTTGQRPATEGPFERLLFELEPARTGQTFPVVQLLPDRVSLPGAALLGARTDDQFAITPAGATRADETNTVAQATVARTDGITVEATLVFRAGHDNLPAGAEAHPVTISAERSGVRIRGAGALIEPVRAAVAREALLRRIDADDPPDDRPVLADVVVSDADLALWDGGTQPLVRVTADPAGVARIVADLVRLARTAALRRLEPGPEEALVQKFAVEWGRVVDGAAQPLAPTGALLHAGERVYLKLSNDSERDLYFFVFDLGVAGAVRMIAGDTSGLRLSAGRSYVIGQADNGSLQGSALYWPPGLATADVRSETLLVIVARTPQDLQVLTHEGVDTRTGGASSLSRLLSSAAKGGSRDWNTPESDRVPFAVTRLEYQLSPVPPPALETARFLVDERPDPSQRLLRPRGVGRPEKVAVRLSELVVHHNRALGDADIRLDTLVLTGNGDEPPTWRARTTRFSRVGDGDRLPLDNLLMYHGPAVDYLDLAWWVSRDRRGSLALNEMLRTALTAEGTQQAISSVATLAVAAPQAALAVAALSGCAVIVTTAYRLLSEVAGNSIGLYRTSLLAGEQFGVGRHPVAGLQAAQDFSFAYEVVNVSAEQVG